MRRREGGVIKLLFDIIGYYFIITGSILCLISALAMIRFPDFYTRLHASSKTLTGGTISILIGIMIFKWELFITLRLLLLIAFLIITNPVTAHAIAKVAYGIGVKPRNIVRDELSEKEER